jgi:hypothetical protein
MPAISDLRLAQACIAAAGRLRGVTARRLEPKALVEALASPRPLVGLEEVPQSSATLGAVRDPCIIALDTPPDGALRQAALEDWPALTKRQSSLADYVYGKQPLFENRPVVFAASPGDATASYLDHAATMSGAPFCCLRDAKAVKAFAESAGCAAVLADADPAAAFLNMGVAAQALNFHSTFAQLYAPDAATRRVLAVAAPGPDLLRELEGLAVELRPADDAEVDLEAALAAHAPLLGAGAVFACDLAGDMFELAPRGTTLGRADVWAGVSRLE